MAAAETHRQQRRRQSEYLPSTVEGSQLQMSETNECDLTNSINEPTAAISIHHNNGNEPLDWQRQQMTTTTAAAAASRLAAKRAMPASSNLDRDDEDRDDGSTCLNHESDMSTTSMQDPTNVSLWMTKVNAIKVGSNCCC